MNVLGRGGAQCFRVLSHPTPSPQHQKHTHLSPIIYTEKNSLAYEEYYLLGYNTM
jgi:hypothetical protein